jgi:hypothetical protein
LLIADVAIAEVGEADHQRSGSLREFPQQHSVCDAENRSAGTDSERDRRDGGDGENRALAQCAAA